MHLGGKFVHFCPLLSTSEQPEQCWMHVGGCAIPKTVLDARRRVMCKAVLDAPREAPKQCWTVMCVHIAKRSPKAVLDAPRRVMCVPSRSEAPKQCWTHLGGVGVCHPLAWRSYPTLEGWVCAIPPSPVPPITHLE